jgi:hypothetical protein
MNDFDKASRFAARQFDPVGFLHWILVDFSWTAWRWTGWLDTQTVPFPGEADLPPDTVATFERTAADAPPLAVIVEFMSQPRRIILERLAEYAFRVRRELPYQSDPHVSYDVIGFVVNLTGSMDSSEWSMAPLACGELGLWTRAKPRNLSTMESVEVLGSIASGNVVLCILPWVALMRGASEPATIEEWKRLALMEKDEEKRRAYAGLALVFADLAGRLEVWQKSLEDWNVERSQVTLEWERRAELRIRRADLLEAMEVRFGQPVPEDVVQVVEAESDLATLQRWFKKALTAANLGDMRATLGLNGA